MLHPSYSELIQVISRYSLVIASAKRARQLIGGDMPLTEDADEQKPLSTAVEEIRSNKVKILQDGEDEE